MKIVLSTILRHYDWMAERDCSVITPIRQQSNLEDSLSAKLHLYKKVKK